MTNGKLNIVRNMLGLIKCYIALVLTGKKNFICMRMTFDFDK